MPEKLTGLVTLHPWLRMPAGAVAFGAMNVAATAVEAPLVGEVVMFAGHMRVGGAELATTNDKDPPAMVPPAACAKIVNDVVDPDGVVENVKVCPPSAVINAEGTAVAETVKSEAIPVVAPLAPETVMVHPMAIPLCAVEVPAHTRLDAIEGVP